MPAKSASTALPPRWPVGVTVAVFMTAFFGIVDRLAATDNANAYRAAFLDAAIRGCSDEQVQTNERAGVSSDAVIESCKCKAEAVTAALSRDQMSRIRPGKALPPDVLAVVRSSIAKCSSGQSSGE